MHSTHASLLQLPVILAPASGDTLQGVERPADAPIVEAGVDLVLALVDHPVGAARQEQTIALRPRLHPFEEILEDAVDP